MGNVIRGSASEGILISPVGNEMVSLSAQFIGNKVSDNGGAAIREQGAGTFDTHYLFNDLRNNGGGAFSGVGASATRLGNLGAPEYIRGHLSATASWNPPGVAPGSFTSTTLTVSGAQVGDTIAVGFDQPVPAGSILAGTVTSANTATVTLFNVTGGALDLGAGTVRVDVWRH